MSIYIGPPEGAGEVVLPPLVEENINSLKEHHPGVSHMLFTNEGITPFLKENFSREVLDAYNVLRPRAYKADLARYCLLYELGGIYADLSYYFVHSLPSLDERPIAFRDFLLSSPWDTSIGVFASPRHHKAFLRAIELVCANVKRGYYGLSPLCPTGPALFGKALAQTCEAEELITGRAVRVKRERLLDFVPGVELPAAPTIHCLTLGRSVIAIKRKRMFSQGLRDLGIDDGDVYSDLWKRRAVYEEQLLTASAAGLLAYYERTAP